MNRINKIYLRITYPLKQTHKCPIIKRDSPIKYKFNNLKTFHNEAN